MLMYWLHSSPHRSYVHYSPGLHLSGSSRKVNRSFHGHDSVFSGRYTPFLWMASEGFWPQYNQHLLSLNRKHHPNGLHHCLAWQMLSLQPQGSPESGVNSDEHHRLQTHSLKGHLQVVMSKQGLPNYNRLQAHFPGCHLAGDRGASVTNKQDILLPLVNYYSFFFP